MTTSRTHGFSGSDPDAVHVSAAGEIAGITEKSTLVAADKLLLEDSVAGDVKKSAPVSALRITESQITDLAHATSASTTAEGISERATQAEVDTGTDVSRHVTPETLANYSGLGGDGAPDGSLNGFRLTLETAVPVSTSDQLAKTTIYLTPFMHGVIDLYSGSAWERLQHAEVSIAVGTLSANTNYDVFAYNNGGTLTLEFSAAWASNTARTDAIVRQDGVYVKSGTTTRRLVGTFRTTASPSQTEDSETKRFVWNMSNRVARKLYKTDTTGQWTYTLAAYRQANGATANKVEAVRGLDEEAVQLTCLGNVANSTPAIGVTAIGLDSITAAVDAGALRTSITSGSAQTSMTAHYSGLPGLGYHYFAWLEWSSVSGTSTWFGNQAAWDNRQGLTGAVMM